jgi:3D (Asp-Asp-Asp) domain-containing protein
MSKKRLDVFIVVLMTITGFIIGIVAGLSVTDEEKPAPLTETTVSQETITEESSTVKETTEVQETEVYVTEETTVQHTEPKTTEDELTTIKYEDIPKLRELGTFKLTAYCICEKCCGKSDGITASSVKATPYKTVAVDKNVIPLGTELYINGDYFVAQDTGGAVKGNVIDVCVSSHEEALSFGVHYAKVFEVN